MAPFQVIAGMCLLGGLIIAADPLRIAGRTRHVCALNLMGNRLIGQHEMHIEYIFYFLTVTAMILYRFRENIQRLLAGTERRLGEGA